MAAVTVFVLAAAACSLYLIPRHPWPRPNGGGTPRSGGRGQAPQRGRRRFRKSRLFREASADAAEASMPRLVRQLSALLASGRSGPALWEALGDVLVTEVLATEGTVPGQAAPRRAAASPGRAMIEQGTTTELGPTVELVRAVERASALGLSTADAVRSACHLGTGSEGGIRRLRSSAHFSAAQRRSWLEVAACFDICEASGAPVAAVLGRLADRLESEQDTAELLETALAGPRATVRLLTFLPFIGLGLGMAMGVDPLNVLFGSQLGWACLAAGLVLVGVGRWWSARLISRAARVPSQQANGPSGRVARIWRSRTATEGQPGVAGHPVRMRRL